MSSRRLTALGAGLVLVGAVLLALAIVAPGPFVGVLLGPLLIGAGLQLLDQAAIRRRRARRGGLLDAHAPDLFARFGRR